MMSQVNKNKPPLQLLPVARENKQNIRFQINYKDKIRSDDIRISTKQALGFNIVILLFSLVNGKESAMLSTIHSRIWGLCYYV